MAADIGSDLKRALLGRAVSMLGNGMQSIALPLMFLKLTDSLSASGTLFAFMQCPAVLLAPWLGLKLESLNKKHCMVALDIAQAGLHGLLLILVLNHAELWLMASLLAVSAVLSQAFNISTSVLLSELSNEANRQRMNGLRGIVDNGVALTAPLLGTLVYTGLGFEAIVLLNIVSFGLSGLMECFIKLEEKPADIQQIDRNYRELIPMFKKKPFVLRLFLITGCLNLFFAPHEEIFYPAVLIKNYHYSETVYGLANLLFVAGMLLTSFILYRFNKGLFSLKTNLLLNSALLECLGFSSLIGISPAIYFVIFMMVMIISGSLTSMINIPLISYFQNEVDAAIQSQFFALQSFTSSCLIPLGIFLAGQLSEISSGGFVMGMFNCCILILVYLLMRGYNIENNQR